MEHHFSHTYSHHTLLSHGAVTPKVGATRNRPPYIISLVSTKRRKIWLSKKKKKKSWWILACRFEKKRKFFKYIYLLYFFFVFLSFKAMSSIQWPWYFQFAHATSGPVKGHQLDKVWELEIPASNSGDHSGGKCRSTFMTRRFSPVRSGLRPPLGSLSPNPTTNVLVMLDEIV